MRRRRIAAAAAAAALLILAPAGWSWGSPWWTLWRMREAARAGDLEGLSAYVDYSAVNAQLRRNFRSWMQSVLDTVRADHPNEAARSFRAYAERELARPDSEIFVPPEDIGSWLAVTPIRFAGLGGGSARDGYRPYLVRYGLDRFEVRDEESNWEMGPVLTFERRGLGWRLVGMRWGQQ